MRSRSSQVKNYFCYFFCLNLVLSGASSRIDLLTGFPLAKIINGSFQICFWLSLFLLLEDLIPRKTHLPLYKRGSSRQELLSLLGLGFLILCVLAHSYAHLFQPSLRWSTPHQNYNLAPENSASYSYSLAKLYMKNVSMFFFPSLVFFQHMKDSLQTKSLSKILLASLSFILIVNIGVALVQGWKDLNFMAAGSGTAVPAGRAAALLEDSGASNAYFAILGSGFFWLANLGPLTWPFRMFTFSLALASILAGKMAAGRLFFLVIMGSVLCLSFFAIRKKAVKIIPLALLASAALWKWAPSQIPLIDLMRHADFSHPIEALNHILLQIDPIRALHIKTMLKAFLLHPLKGTGLGFYYANYADHLQWALSTGGAVFTDPPSSLYLMLLSELGLVGAALILALFLGLGMLLRDLSKPQEDKDNAWPNFCLGAVIALLLVWNSGIPVLFTSIGALAGLLLASLFLLVQASFPKTLQTFFFTMGGILLLGCAYQYKNAPRAVAFRWAETGHPQIPLTLSISPEEQAYADTTFGPGLWIKSGTEILLSKDKIEFSVLEKDGNRTYPLDISIAIYDQEENVIAQFQKSIQQLDRTQTWIEIPLDKDLTHRCLEKIDVDYFCSVRFTAKPVWKVFGQKAAVFIPDRQLK
ncbi:MAG: O-antigen ligase family protein [Oligoflexales bacterium]|nr:O-antigen ligase family protein [Oligoflexales bacterium]